jgi:hypothetical protein
MSASDMSLKQLREMHPPKVPGHRPADLPVECMRCGRQTTQWALRRIHFLRSEKQPGGGYKQRQHGSYSTGRYCADCIAKELTEQPS